MSETIDIGHGHAIRFVGWHPDRDLNPQYADIPDIEESGVLVEHQAPDGSECASFAHFDTEDVRRVFAGSPVWKVGSREPLSLSPSLLCKRCGDHGHIRNGRWEPA
jgi:hypothetical protein